MTNLLRGVVMALGVMLLAACTGSSIGPGLYGTSVASEGPAFTGPLANERRVERPVQPTVVAVAHVRPQTEVPGPVFSWTNVGGDPCSPKAGCTLAWALEQAGKTRNWPLDVQSEFLRIVPTVPADEVMLAPGWRGWMTWGRSVRKFHPNTRADFTGGKPEPAQRWTVRRSGNVYSLYKVLKCGNWGGDEDELPGTPTVGIPPTFCP